jgi:GH15 family glucan-1,4-alpha-glucosidase
VRRYQVAEQDENVDGLPGREGRFLLCSCWLVDCLIGLSELDRAQALLDSLLARANDLGLFSEEVDATTGAFLGNFPQAFSHFGVINAIVNLARARGDGDHRLGLDFADITGAIPGGPERRRMVGDARRKH